MAMTATIKGAVQCFLEKKLDANLEDCAKCSLQEVCSILEEVWRAALFEAEEDVDVDPLEGEEQW